MVGKSVGYARSFGALRHAALLLAIILTPSCAGRDPGPPLPTAEVPLHLEGQLDAARIEGSDVPAESPAPIEWRFDEPQPDWKPVVPLDPAVQPVQVARTEDALRLTLVGRPPAPATPLEESTSACRTGDARTGARFWYGRGPQLGR